jgi:hypothetical protein
MNPLPNLKVTISKTADGSNDYMQIVSDDQFALNIVLIAGKIEVADSRPAEKPKRGKK